MARRAIIEPLADNRNLNPLRQPLVSLSYVLPALIEVISPTQTYGAMIENVYFISSQVKFSQRVK